MSIELSNDQRQAIDQAGTPITVVDPLTGSVYVLVKESVYARLRNLLNDDLSDSYTAQIESAMRAGWDDPAMDEYNDYDRHRNP